MLDTIFIGTSGLLAHAKGLRVVGNNLANVNTPGYKSSQLQFGELFDHGGAASRQANSGSGSGSAAFGTGVDGMSSRLNFKAGVDQTTGNPLDLQIDGNGFYVLRRGEELLYSRSGDFRFDPEGVLVNGNGDHVQALDENGQLTDVTLDSFANSLPKATTEVKIMGNVPGSPIATTVTTALPGVNVVDQDGIAHTLKLTFQNNGAGAFTVSVSEDAGPTLGTGNIKFAAGFPVPGSDAFTFMYTPAGGTAMAVNFSFSERMSALSGASTLSVLSSDGYVAGVRSDQGIDPDGKLVVHFSNGQKVDGMRLALANFDADQDLEQAGSSTFRKVEGALVEYGNPKSGSFGGLTAGHREGSNVDLAEEFSNLILMQRGYQASSHVISTANDMIQQLFDMKGR